MYALKTYFRPQINFTEQGWMQDFKKGGHTLIRCVTEGWLLAASQARGVWGAPQKNFEVCILNNFIS
jgi:hypothetical protein